jgi:hypothetical protein
MVFIPLLSVAIEPSLGYGTDEAAARGYVEMLRGTMVLLQVLDLILLTEGIFECVYTSLLAVYDSGSKLPS